MGTKKVKEAVDATTERVAAGVEPVQRSERKNKKKAKAKAQSEIDGNFKEKAPVQESVKKKEEEIVKAKGKSEIDDIFGQKKRKKVELGEDAQAAAKKKERESSEVVKLNSKGELVKPKKLKEPKPAKSASAAVAAAAAAVPTSRRKTEDGFTVYTAEELGFNKKNAGGTKLCPFDCDCCF